MSQQQMINLTIDGVPVSVPKGTTIMQAAEQKLGVKIPRLCHHPKLSIQGSCRVCVVEVEGARSLVRSCVQAAAPNMKVTTASARVMEARRTVVELLLANHPDDCLACVRNGNCELQAMAERMGVRRKAFPRTKKVPSLDHAGFGVFRDNDKCILCGRCVAVCRETQSVSAIDCARRAMPCRNSGRVVMASPC